MDITRQEFYDLVYDAIRQIPYGRVTTYGQIAKLVGYPKHSRMVGQSLRELPSRLSNDNQNYDNDEEFIPVPWHRVLNSSGLISPRGSDAAVQRQAERLINEGVHVSTPGDYDGDVPNYMFGHIGLAGGRVSLRQYGWFPDEL